MNTDISVRQSIILLVRRILAAVRDVRGSERVRSKCIAKSNQRDDTAR